MEWLRLSSTNWPTQSHTHSVELPIEEERDVCLHSVADTPIPVIPLERFSSFARLKRVTTWICRFIDNCHCRKEDRPTSLYLSTSELVVSENYWISLAQSQTFVAEIEAIKDDESLTKSSRLFSLHPFLDATAGRW